MVGIYRIKNTINFKCYYGSAKNINRRWSKHKSQLKYGRHENIILQKAWDKYGKESFIFEIIELCKEDELLIIEQKYLDLKPEYNIGKEASGGDNLTNHPNKNKIIEDRNISQRIHIDNLSDSERKEKWSRPKEINGRWKGGVSIKHCECGKQITFNSNYCMDCLPRNGKNNPFYNKHHTDKTKKILSEQRKDKYYGKQNIIFSIDGVEYKSLGEASKKLETPITTIRWRLKSKNEKYKNYKYI